MSETTGLLHSGPGDPDPYPMLAWMRSTMPITQVPGESGRTWFVTSYRLARTLLQDPRLSNDASRFHDMDPDQVDLLASDPPTHTRLRRAAFPAFTPRSVQELRPMLERTCTAAIDAFARDGSADLVTQYALPVAVTVIHEVLGVPEHLRAEPATVMDLFLRMGFVEPPGGPALAGVRAYVGRFLEYKRDRDHRGDDLLSGLLDARERGELATDEELHGVLYVLMGAGHTSSVPFLGSAVLRVLQHPEHIPALTDPVRRRAIVEEALRYDPAVQSSVNRYATEPIEVGGAHLRPGDKVVVSVAAANRDPDRFAQPDQFRPDAGHPSHMAFGHGIHACLGAHLARLEAEVALEILFRRVPTLRLAVPPDAVTWALGPMLRGPREVPVTFDPEPAHPSVGAA